MADVKTWLAGFTYRGRAPWEGIAPDYHVEVGEYIEVEGRDPVQLGVKQMTPDAATAAGYSLPATLKAINGDALSEVAALRAKVLELSEAKTSAEELLKEAQAEIAKAEAARQKDAASISGLQSVLKATQEELTGARAALDAVEAAQPPEA